MARLLLDAMLGRLATYLRMCGYDAAYALDEGVEEADAVLSLARREGRTLVTRNQSLADRYPETVLLCSRELTEQLTELSEAGFSLGLPETPERCSICNGTLTRVSPDEPTPEYAPSTAEFDVWRCEDCGQQFWRGSHWEEMRETLEAVGACDGPEDGSDQNPNAD